jgi:hypothetical protein
MFYGNKVPSKDTDEVKGEIALKKIIDKSPTQGELDLRKIQRYDTV